MHLSFETPRLLLKPTTEEDAPFLLELYNSPKWLRFIGDRNIRTIAQAEDWINTKITPQFDRLGFGNYIVLRKSDQARIGTCGLYDREGVDGIDIGFAFLPQYEKQGYAFEAASKIMDIGFKLFSLQKISAITMPENIASQRLLGKLGLQFQQIIKLPDDQVELMLYVLEVPHL